MELTTDAATAIIVEAKAHDVYSGELPEDEGVRLQEAKRIAEMAYEARNAGAQGEAIMTIINIVEASAPETPPQAEEPEESDPYVPTVEPAAPEPNSDQFDKAFEAKALALARVRTSNLPIPPSIEDQPPVLPRDLTALSDLEIRRYSSEFNACHARANWEVALLDADEEACKSIIKHYQNKAIQRSDKLDPETKKPKTIPVLEAEASEDPNVVIWQEKYLEIRTALRFFKALRDTYSSNCDRISREWSMRDAERNHS